MFDPNMTYWQSLKVVTRGLIQRPLTQYEIETLWEALKNVAWGVLCPIIRVILLLTLPISATIMTLIVHLYRKNKAKGNV